MQMCVNEGIPRSWGGRVRLGREGVTGQDFPEISEGGAGGSGLPCSSLCLGLDRVNASAEVSKERSQQGAG